MGFRFQKRIKLGKGIGLNISKSSITPSYKNKRGSISSKGYSLRTGIPGLSYRKTFKKAKGSGCFVILFLVVTFTLSIISCDNKISKPINQWYQGGTLHKAKIVDWKSASTKNKLATCGDFCAKIYSENSLDQIKVKATDLMTCIDEAVKGHDSSDNYDVPDIASMCLLLLEN